MKVNLRCASRALLLVLAAIFVFGFSACSSDEESDDFEEILTEGMWAQSGSKNLVSFSSDGTFSMYKNNDGTLKPIDVKGQWTYSDDKLLLYRSDDDVSSDEPVDTCIVYSYNEYSIYMTSENAAFGSYEVYFLRPNTD